MSVQILIVKLIDVIYTLRMQYERQREQEEAALPAPTVIGTFRPRVILRGAPVIFELLNEETLAAEPDYAESDFRTLVHVDRGATVKLSTTRAHNYEIQIDEEETRRVSSQATVKDAVFAELSAGLTDTLQRRLQVTATLNEQQMEERTYTIDASDAGDIVSYEIQWAPLMRRKRAIIRMTCTCCGMQNHLVVGFREPSGRFVQRRREHLRDGTLRQMEIGGG